MSYRALTGPRRQSATIKIVLPSCLRLVPACTILMQSRPCCLMPVDQSEPYRAGMDQLAGKGNDFHDCSQTLPGTGQG
jgi:hypothetical protein